MKQPTYKELAKLLSDLVEANIANPGTEHAFVRCFTYERIPPHWHAAIEAREALAGILGERT